MICGNTVLEHFFSKNKNTAIHSLNFLRNILLFSFFLLFFFWYSKIPIQTEYLSSCSDEHRDGFKSYWTCTILMQGCEHVFPGEQVSSGVKEATAPKGAPDVGGSRQLQTSDWKPFCASQLPIEDVYSRSLSQGHSSLSGYLRVPKTDRPQFCTPLSLIPNQKRC